MTPWCPRRRLRFVPTSRNRIEAAGTGGAEAKKAVYGNHRRIRGKRGCALQRSRSEKVERTFAHCYDTGGMRRTHLRGHENIHKRLLVHVMGYNLSLVLRKLFGFGTPRSLQGALSSLSGTLVALQRALERLSESDSGSWQLEIVSWFQMVTRRHVSL